MLSVKEQCFQDFLKLAFREERATIVYESKMSTKFHHDQACIIEFDTHLIDISDVLDDTKIWYCNDHIGLWIHKKNPASVRIGSLNRFPRTTKPLTYAIPNSSSVMSLQIGSRTITRKLS